jgi:ribosomal protein L44E
VTIRSLHLLVQRKKEPRKKLHVGPKRITRKKTTNGDRPHLIISIARTRTMTKTTSRNDLEGHFRLQILKTSLVAMIARMKKLEIVVLLLKVQVAQE